MSTEAQAAVCARFGVTPHDPAPFSKTGLSAGVESDRWPVHGRRHPPTDGTNGWYIWVGEFSHAADFFAPHHVEHLGDYRPAMLPYLALPPGWRFLIAPDDEDVWSDEALLDVD